MKKFLTEMQDEWHKNIIKEWHPALNGDLKPSDVTVSSNKKVWWRCQEGHEWQASVRSRSNGAGCPYDIGKLPIRGKTDLETLNLCLAAEWHPTLNGNLKPSEVHLFGRELVWWQCKEGHEWQATVQSRINGSGCPYDV